jgi:excisionase family DNA binding protein
MSYSLSEAARAAGVNKSTILRAIKAGKISAVRDEASGGWSIDPAELHRVYPPVAEATHEAATRNGRATGEAALLREMLADRDATIDDLRRRLDAAEDERRTTLRQLTALLTDQRNSAAANPGSGPTQAAGRRRWWRFGRRE